MSASDTFANEMVAFLNESSTAFHAVKASANRLDQAGFTRLNETDVWTLVPNGKYYFTRNTTTIVAFTVGGKFLSSGDVNGYTILGAHTDSPCFKVKPVCCFKKSDALMVNTQPYGGGLWHTWFDRDLGLAGRILHRGSHGEILSTLVQINEPIARIPNLAIHLTSGSERESFAPNLQEHAKALLTFNGSLLNMTADDVEGSEHTSRIHPALLRLLSQHSGIPASAIEDAELQLIDVQPSTRGGIDGEFIISGRLDNLCSSYQCLRAIIDGSNEDLSNQTNVRLAFLFDHEEVGSSSYNGAASSLFMDTLRLINSYLLDGSTRKFELTKIVWWPDE
jgi:aspartyl aminopeptidase